MTDFGALPDQHEDLSVGQPIGQVVDLLGVVVPDRHLVAGQLGEAVESPHRVEIVIENGDLHGSLRRLMASSPASIAASPNSKRSSPLADVISGAMEASTGKCAEGSAS